MKKIRHLSDEEKMEICYEVCEQANFKRTKALYSSVNLYADEIKNYAYKYIKKVLKRNLTEDEFKFIADKRIINLLENPIIDYMIKEKAISKNKLKDYCWIIDKLEEELSKFCYELFANNDWMAIKVRKICEANHLSYKFVNAYCYKYNSDYSKESKEDYTNKRMEGQVKSIKLSILENTERVFVQDRLISNILDAETDEEVIKIMIESGKLPSQVTSFAFEYSLKYGVDSEKLVKALKIKLECYSNYLASKRNAEVQELKELKRKIVEEESLIKLKNIIRDFEVSEIFSIKKYCKQIGLPIREFKNLLSLLKKYDQESYDRFLAIENEKNQKATIKNKADFEKVKIGIRNGVIDRVTGEKREFDLLDYYEITDLSPIELCSSLSDLSSDDYILIRLFNAKYPSNKVLMEYDINCILDVKRVLNAKFDEKGNYIPESGRMVERTEKEQAFEYLKSKNIPISYETYELALNRLLDGSLIKEDEKNKVYKLGL